MRQSLFYLALFFSLVCFGLGFWQWQRLAWKEDLISQIEAKCRASIPHGAPLALPPQKAWRPLKQEGKQDDWAFQKIVFKGIAQKQKVKLWHAGSYHRLSFVKVNGGFLLVRATAAAAKQLEKKTKFQAVLYPSQERRFYDGKDDPAKGIYYVADVEKVARDLGIAPVFPLFADLSNTCPRLSNRHFGYMLTWWLLMLALPLVVLFARKRV